MYHEYFGLRCNPFQHAPSAEFFFASRSHREALAALHWGLSDPTGLVLLTGDVGTGKTTVIRELFSRETRDVRTALVKNPKLSFDALLENILHQLGVETSQGRAQMLDALQRATERQRVVVVIDEAQQLSNEALEEFRLLTNSSPEGFQLMLAGQPELLERLGSPELRQLNQRIAVRAVLNPLSSAETIDYLRHRIRAAGGEAGRIFTRRALRAIAQASRGIPRRANILSHNALLFAYSAGSRKVRSAHIRAAVADYDRASLYSAPPSSAYARIWRRSLPPALLLLAGITIGFLSVETAHNEKAPRAMRVAAQDRALADTTAIHASAAAPAPKAAAVLPPSKIIAALPLTPAPDVIAQTKPGEAVDADEPHYLKPAADSAETGRDHTTEIVVQKGDTLSAIAERYSNSTAKLDPDQLAAANPEIKDANLIYPGEKLRLQTK